MDDFQDIFNSLATSYNPPNEVSDFLSGIEKFLGELNDDLFTKFVRAIKGNHLSQAIDYLNELVLGYQEDDSVKVIDEDGKIVFGNFGKFDC